MTEGDITALARKLGLSCRRRGVTVATAESCTGGGVAEAITRIAGSSAWFDRGFVSYQNLAKKQMLGVKQRTLEQHGAVSGEVAREMALGALSHSEATVSVAVTGIAGPTGAVPGKPVGTVWLAWAAPKSLVQVRGFHLAGDRAEVRIQSVSMAIQGLIDLLR